MRVLFVVQRYGPQIAGGAEHLVRRTAEQLAERGHGVQVLTGCAHSYVDWADVEEPGTTALNGVTVHRLAGRRRDNRCFGPVHERATGVADRAARMAPGLDAAWARAIGPDLGGLDEALHRLGRDVDVVVFSGYMFSPTLAGLPRIAPFVPTVLQSVAHDEPPLRMPAVARAVRHADAVNVLTPEEAELVRRRFRPQGICRVVGAGLDDPVPGADPAAVRRRLGLGDDPYLLTVGRLDPAKGVHELADLFIEHKRRHPGPLRLVAVGAPVHPLPPHPDIVVAGFVDDDEKWALLADCELLVQPSYFESFSLSLAEAWQTGKAALVQGRCDVLAGQVARSGGGLTYRDFAGFDAALEVLRADRARREAMGAAGHRYVQQYRWPVVLDQFESLLTETVASRHPVGAPARIPDAAAPPPTRGVR